MKFSIITVCYNALEDLKLTVESIARQSLQDFEHVIVDGGSEDGTLEYLGQLADGRVRWKSEADRGIFEAMNKGIRMARGEVVSFLNAGDTYTPQALEYVAATIDRGYDYVFGSVISGDEIRSSFRPQDKWYTFDYYTRHSVGFFIKRSVHETVGLYDTRFRNNADMDLFFRLVSDERFTGTSTRAEEVVGSFALGGFSNTTPYLDRITEELRIRIKNGQSWPIALLLFLIRFIKHIRKVKDYS